MDFHLSQFVDPQSAWQVFLVIFTLVGLRIVFSVSAWTSARQRAMKGLCDFFNVQATPLEAERSLLEFVDSGLMALGLVFLIIRPFVVQAFFIPSGSMRPTLYGTEDRSHRHKLADRFIYYANDRILVNKFIYRFRDPRRQDIIVFAAPERIPQGKGKDYIKRLIGLPGDRIEIREGSVYVNGERLEEPYLGEKNRPTYYWPLVKIQNNRIYTRAHEQAKAFDGPSWPIEEWIGKSYEEMPPQLKGVWPADLTQEGPIRVPQDCYFVLGDNRNNSNDSHRWGFLKRDRVRGKAMLIFWPPIRKGDYGQRRWNIRLLR